MNYVLLATSIFAAVVFGTCAGYVGKNLINSRADTHAFNAIQYFLASEKAKTAKSIQNG